MKKILLIILLFVGVRSSAQLICYDSTKNLTTVSGSGFLWKEGRFCGTLWMPQDTIHLAVKDSGASAYKNGTVYIYTGYYWRALAFSGVAISTAWLKTGNTGINPNLNWVGTNDAQPLIFHAGGDQVGYISGDGNHRTDLGFQNTLTSGVFTFAVNRSNTVSGSYSTAIGTANKATGFVSLATGDATVAAGDHSLSAGFETKSKHYAGTVIGHFNDSTLTSPANGSGINPNNRVFQIGIGTANNARANAMTILASGATALNKYGSGTFTGTPTKALNVDASGNIIEGSVATGGTLTTFSSGDLSPLFTTSVANPTTTPALSFSLSNAGAYTLFGRAASTGAPSFLTSIDSNWIPTLHSENYYNTKYLGAGSGVTTVGTFSASSIANGASISGHTITLGVADGTNPGMMSTTTQTMLGAKTFSTSIYSPLGLFGAGTSSVVSGTVLQAGSSTAGAGRVAFDGTNWLINRTGLKIGAMDAAGSSSTACLSLSANTSTGVTSIQGWIDGGPTYYALALQPTGGNVGIGTLSSTVPLQINKGSVLKVLSIGSAATGSYVEKTYIDSAGAINILSSKASSNPILVRDQGGYGVFRINTGASGGGGSVDIGDFTGVGGQSMLNLLSPSGGYQLGNFQHNGTDLLITNSSGSGGNNILFKTLSNAIQFNIGTNSYLTGSNLGIGITSPTKPLHIKNLNPQIELEQTTSGQKYISRIGINTGTSNTQWNFFDSTANKIRYAVNNSIGTFIIGNTTSGYSQSSLYVTDLGTNGANIDAQDDSTKSGYSNIETMAADYTNGYGTAIRHWSNSGYAINASTVAGFGSKNMSLFDLTDSVNIIRVNTNHSLRIATNNIERVVIDSIGKVKFDQYGSGTFTGTPTKSLNVDASGNIIEGPVAVLAQTTDRQTAQTGSVTLAAATVGASDASYLVSGNVLVTTATLHNFTVTVTYTDEGNTSRTVTMQFSTVAGAFVTAMTNAQGTVPYEGVPLHIRCKAGTTITLATAGTFTGVAYNFEESIRQIN